LTGPELSLVEPRQLPTEGLQIGSIQVPPSGQPIVHLANHPPTGGYPVIAVVDEPDLPMLAQSLPGTVVRFARGAPGRRA
jgi:allophanate hydrolase subunit 2